jgi:hypothetical protein
MDAVDQSETPRDIAGFGDFGGQDRASHRQATAAVRVPVPRPIVRNSGPWDRRAARRHDSGENVNLAARGMLLCRWRGGSGQVLCSAVVLARSGSGPQKTPWVR